MRKEEAIVTKSQSRSGGFMIQYEGRPLVPGLSNSLNLALRALLKN